MATSPTLTCPQCSYVNEAERVYCHNCGSKLDRSLLPKDAQRDGESPAASRKRVKQMTNPGSNPVMRELKTLVRTLFWAAAVAVLVLIALQPADVPGKPNPPLRRVDSDMFAAAQSLRPVRFSFDENDINSYLGSVKSKAKGWIPGVEFQRAYVQLTPGTIRIGMEQSAWGYSFYTSIDERIGVKDGTFWVQQAGGHFGRLALHPMIMEYGDIVFNHLWNALGRERKQMDLMQSITIDKGRITFVTKGPRTP